METTKVAPKDVRPGDVLDFSRRWTGVIITYEDVERTIVKGTHEVDSVHVVVGASASGMHRKARKYHIVFTDGGQIKVSSQVKLDLVVGGYEAAAGPSSVSSDVLGSTSTVGSKIMTALLERWGSERAQLDRIVRLRQKFGDYHEVELSSGKVRPIHYDLWEAECIGRTEAAATMVRAAAEAAGLDPMLWAPGHESVLDRTAQYR